MHEPIKFGGYYLFERIAIGGMAEVFKGIQFGVEGFERTFAVKRVLPSIAEDQDFIDMFIDEAKIAVQLTHANVGQIFELGQVEDTYFIAMEFVQGKDGRALFDRSRERGEYLDIPMVCHIIKEVCEALEYAHAKRNDRGESLELIHRDVSPQNILIGYDGQVKLIDFGIAKAAGKASQTQAGILKGKFSYMSPEQVRGKPIDWRSDLFSLAVCLYELLTSERCFSEGSDFSTIEKVRDCDFRRPTLINRDIPPELERIIYKGITREPDQRFQSAAEFQDALQKFLYQSGSFYSRKNLADYMRKTFAGELAQEQHRTAMFKEYARKHIPEARRPDDPPVSVVTELDPDDLEVFDEPDVPEAAWVQEQGEEAATEVYDRDPGDPIPDELPFARPEAPAPSTGRSTMAQGSGAAPMMPGWNPVPGGPVHPAATGGHPAITGGHPAATGGHPAITGGHPAVTGGHPAITGGHPAVTGGHPAATGGHPAISGGHPAITGGHPAMTGPQPAVSGGHPVAGGPYVTGGHQAPVYADPAVSGGFPQSTGGHPAAGYGTGAQPAVSGAYAAQYGHHGGITGPPGGAPAPGYQGPQTVPGDIGPHSTFNNYEESGGRRLWVVLLVALLSVGLGVAAVFLFTDRAELGSLVIQTNPTEVEVYIDGRKMDPTVTPMTIGNLKAGEHEVRVLADGYDPAERTVILNPGEQRVLPFELAPSVSPTLLVVKSDPSGARVFIDDKLADLTPFQVDTVAPGMRQIRLEKDGYQPWTGKVRVEQGKQNLLPPVQLYPSEVSVTFLPEPEDAEVKLTIRLGNGAEKVLEAGNRRFEGLPNDGRSVVIAEAEGYEQVERPLARFRDPAVTEVLTLEKSPEKPRKRARRGRTPRRPDPKPAVVEAPKEDGFLKLLAKPPAQARVRGKSLGWTPILKHALPPGTYTVELVRDQEPTYEARLRVTIKPGETTFERYTHR